MQWWEVLGVGPNAGAQEIKRAYSRLIKQYRPHEYPAEFSQIRQAYELARKTKQTGRKRRRLDVRGSAQQKDVLEPDRPVTEAEAATPPEPAASDHFRQGPASAFGDPAGPDAPRPLEDRPGPPGDDLFLETGGRQNAQGAAWRRSAAQEADSNVQAVRANVLEKEITGLLDAWSKNRYHARYIDRILAHAGMEDYDSFIKISEICLTWFVDNPKTGNPWAIWSYRHFIVALSRLNRVFNWDQQVERLSQTIGDRVDPVLTLLQRGQYQSNPSQRHSLAKWFILFVLFASLVRHVQEELSIDPSASTLYMLSALALFVGLVFLERRFGRRLLARLAALFPDAVSAVIRLCLSGAGIIFCVVLIGASFMVIAYLAYVLIANPAGKTELLGAAIVLGFMTLFSIIINKRLVKFLGHSLASFQYAWAMLKI